MRTIDELLEQVRKELASCIRSNFPDCAVEDVFVGLKKMTGQVKSRVSDDAGLAELKRHGIVLRMAESAMKFGKATRESCMRDLASYKAFRPGCDISFWKNKLEESGGHHGKGSRRIRAIGRDILSEWRKDYESAVLKRELELVEELRNALWGQVKKWLEALQAIKMALGKGEMGMFWDLSLGELAREDLETVLKIAKFIESNPGVRQLCDILGRMAAHDRRKERERIMASVEYETIVPDVNSREEIVGLEFGRRVDDIVPAELATMSDNDLSIVFDQKYVEGRLLSFQRTGHSYETRKSEQEQWREKTKEDERGPIILCVDTSGSMAGAPEAVAKAVAFALASKAHKENRSCYLITFSVGIEVFDFTANQSLRGLLSFLQLGFHGGTDVAPALAKGIEMMKTPMYAKADLLVVSDFVMDNLSEKTLEDMECRKKAKNRFFALTIEQGNSSWRRFQSATMFDAAWRYDATNQDVRVLADCVDRMLEKAEC